MNNSIACKWISTGRLQKNVSLQNSEIVSYKNCINLVNSTFNLYVLYIKVTQDTKQFRRLIIENLITVIHFFFGRKRHFMGFGSGFLGC